ncbi:MAG TPA: hypothetical protein PKA00_11220 [Saprospiraceae bacterium]|nr:hypothetical protein [Saprospiraceae bacterium]HMQ83472.1 hypothetical protein [Saprospiraceae bacterium]
MDPIFKKLNYKDQPSILVLQAPESFQTNMEAMKTFTQPLLETDALEAIEFAIAFVTRQEEINELVPRLVPRLKGDAVLWLCYPKSTSKKYTCNFNRDTGWAILGAHGMEPVRQVAIDEDWSALRFRRVEYIKKITRSENFAMTAEAKRRTTHKKSTN